MYTFLIHAVIGLHAVATYPWIGALLKTVGDDRVQVEVLARPQDDPHFVVPRPSLILKLRKADLLVVQGADLEVGFLPALVQQAGNARILPGNPGYLDLSQHVSLIQVPASVSRAQGDVHPKGNPHYHLDPRNIPALARAVQNTLCQLDAEGCDRYEARLQDFLTRWDSLLAAMEPYRQTFQGSKAVSYHQVYDYWLNYLGVDLAGTLEPYPGIPPTPGHILKLQKLLETGTVRWILQDVYHDRKSANYLSRKTGVPVVVLPHDVGSVPEAQDLFSLFRTLLQRMEEAHHE